MPDVRCSECGKIVRVQGLAATCPQCGNLILTGQLPRPTPVEPQAAAPQHQPTKSAEPVDENDPVDLSTLVSELEPSPDFYVPVSHADSFKDPAPLQPLVSSDTAYSQPDRRRSFNPATWETWQIVAAAVGVFIVFALLIDVIRLHFGSSNPNNSVATNVSPSPADGEPQPTKSRPPAESPAPVETPVSLPSPAPAPPPVVAPPPAPAPVTKPAVPAYPFEALSRIVPTPPREDRASRLPDQAIAASLKRGVENILGQFSGSRLREGDGVDAETFAGKNALCAYAMLHAGLSLNDPRFTPQSEEIKRILARLKDFPMEGNRSTYSRSLRIGALSVYNRPDDRSMIENDAGWLLKSNTHGRFTYSMIDDNARLTGNSGWDNSNSQYGALGLWLASDAGVKVPNVFWSDVERHWIETQSVTGAWGYTTSGSGATLAMTAAGVTSLLVARDQMIANASDLATNGDAPKALRRGLEWLDEGNNVLNIEAGGHPGYALYGLERAGLATGYRFFGSHDWYLELSKKRLAEQKADGSWEGGDGSQVETAFTILFLSRGRHPVLLSKLKFDGNWQNNPRDLEYLTRFASQSLERPLNWQIVEIDRPWLDWSDSGLLYLATDRPPTLTGEQIDKLRSYIEAGGLLLTQADNGSASVNAFANDLARQLFPNYLLTELPSDHPIYSAVFPQKSQPKLFGVSNGVRLLMVHSPADLGKAWQKRNDKLNRSAFETGLNIAVYSTGRREFRNRLESLYVADPVESPVATVPLARLKYDGAWNPEPGAWPREAKAIESETRLHVDVRTIESRDLRIEDAPVASLCVLGPLKLSSDELGAIRQFVTKGGVLLVDAMGGGKATIASINDSLIARLAPGASATALSADSPILTGGVGLEPATPLKLRPYASQVLGTSTAPPLRALKIGSGQIIISDVDLTSGLLGTATWGVVGYQPTTSHALAKNLVVWSMRLPPR